ncbi:MAG: hypothetical protein KBD65_02665, partial [Candidatus Moranbacteria bacterium]|nr:hypothetical protein [Candidatus Moranbacteria bacterium]
MSKKKIISGIILILIIGGGYYYFSHRSTGEVVQTEVVKRGDVAETVSVTGELVPEEYADLSFPGAGTIDAVMAHIGDMVTQGQTIASLDREVLFSQLKDARLAADIAVQNEQLYLRNK